MTIDKAPIREPVAGKMLPQPWVLWLQKLGKSLETVSGREMSTDPADPSEGEFIMWQSDGTGSGDDGDIMVKITAGGTTKTTTLLDFSTL